MARPVKLVLWEMNNPLVVLILFVGLILGFAAVHQAYLSVGSAVGGRYPATNGQYTALNFSTKSNSIQIRALEGDYFYTSTGRSITGDLRVGFGVYTFITILMGSLIFRWDRDSGYASVLYSLPYSKSTVFVAKFTAFLTLSLTLYVLPYLLAVIPSNADILSVVLDVLKSRETLKIFALSIYAVLYTVSVIAFIASILPGLFPTIIGAFFLISISSNIFPNVLPPFSFITVPVTYSLSPLEARFMIPGLIIPLVLFILGLYVFERRDVV